MPDQPSLPTTDDKLCAILLPRLYERDIDVLLQEELIFNQNVALTFAKALGLTHPLHVRDCRLSVVDQTGETDVFALFETGGQKGLLLIENKIDAGFQPRQPERYRERAELFAVDGKLDLNFCVLVAPKRYAPPSSASLQHFDAVISYEDIAAAISSESTERANHRAALLLRAVEQARSSYTMAPVPEVGDLWQRIFEIASREFPDLEMAAPSDKGSQSKWIIFKADLPAKITIDWKITSPSIELSFWPGAIHWPVENIDLSALAGARREMSGKTTAIRLPGPRPPADWTKIPNEQIREALGEALKLLHFYRTNSGHLVSDGRNGKIKTD